MFVTAITELGGIREGRQSSGPFPQRSVGDHWYPACIAGSVRSRCPSTEVVMKQISTLAGGWTALAVVCLALVVVFGTSRYEPAAAQGGPTIIWYDSFDDQTPLEQKYFEYDDAGGRFAVVAGVGVNGSPGLRAVYAAGVEDAGHLHRTFGRNPVNSQGHSTTDFREVYWRLFVKNEAGWSGNPFKLSRVTSFANRSWAQAMIAHVWAAASGTTLMLDPASGVDGNGQLVTTGYNDFAHLRWLGGRDGTTRVFDASNAGHWYCVESHVKLNSPGASDGVFEFWVDGKLEAGRSDLNWVGTWAQYGINILMVENYWNGGPRTQQTRYIDELAVATGRIGCAAGLSPQPPTNVRVVR